MGPAAQMIGIADGVGGWAQRGTDAGEYARKLMLHASVSVRNQNMTNGFINPKTVLLEAFKKNDIEHSSTACIITLRGREQHCANVGDSKFVVIHAGQVVFRSHVQQKIFNCPYQLERIKRGDSLEDADLYIYKVEECDIIIAGTDGLFDNVEETKLESMVGQQRNVTLEHLAKEIAKFVRKHSENRASHVTKIIYRGNKYNDITVIVAHVLLGF